MSATAENPAGTQSDRWLKGFFQRQRGHVARSFTVIEEPSGDAVRIEISPRGLAGLIGRPDLLNFFCDQLQQFRGLMGDSLPEGCRIHLRVADAELDHETIPPLFRVCPPTSAVTRNH
jgi:hypothetical protein